MEDVINAYLQDGWYLITAGYLLVGVILGAMFGSVCAWLHPDNHIGVWMILWPIKLFRMLFRMVESKIACKKYGHIDKDYDRGYALNSDTISLYCNRCGKLLKTIPVKDADDKTKECIDAFNEVGNKMFPKGKDIDLRITK